MEPSTKRKKPPSFPHVHPSRARKFKKAWVEKAKITSKWKAQKKKEGLMDKAKLEIPQYGFEDKDENPSPSTSGLPPQREGSTKTTQHRRSKQNEEPKSIKKPDEDGVRELMREAYSKSTLHTFKSDPLQKHAVSPWQKGEKGKGQPDMKLRMNALLAKIKRDYA